MGQFVDVSLCESAMALAVPALANGLITNPNTPRRGTGYLDGGLPNYHIYQTKDNRFMSVGALEPQFWKQFLDHLKMKEKIDFDSNSEQGVRELFASKTLDEWTEITRKIDVCIEPILDTHDVVNHPQHKHRRVFLESCYESQDRRNTLKQMIIGPRLSNHKHAETFRRAAVFGEHTREVLLEAGYSEEEINDLVASQSVFCQTKDMEVES